MFHTAPSAPTASAALPSFVSRILASCIDIHSLWSIDHSPEAAWLGVAPYKLLAFADLQTLQSLRRSTDVHREDLDFLVVFDGDRFESAWGKCKVSGSLSRWAWRYVSRDEAYYDESRWDPRNANAGGVVRLRRKALLVWESAFARSRCLT